MNANNLLFTTVRDVKNPVRAHDTDAGVDFFVPNDVKEIKIAPHGSVLIPSGIKVIIPEGYALIAMNKSGVATKKKLVVGACVVDEGYTDEVHIHLINTSDDECYVNINPGDKIVQFVLVKVGSHTPKYIDNNEFDELTKTCERGMNGFGSTGTN